MTQEGVHVSTLAAGDLDVKVTKGERRNVVMQSLSEDVRAEGSHVFAPRGEARFTAAGDVYLGAIELHHTLAVDERTFSVSFGGANKSEFLSHVEAMQTHLKKKSVVGATGSMLNALGDLQATTARANEIVGSLASGDIFGTIAAAGLGKVRIGFESVSKTSNSTHMQGGQLNAQLLHVQTGAGKTVHMRGTEIGTAEINLDADHVEFGSVKEKHSHCEDRKDLSITLDPFTKNPGDGITVGVNVSRNEMSFEQEHQGNVHTLRLNFIRPAVVTIHGNSEFDVADIVGEVEKSRMIREEEALVWARKSLFAKVAVGMNTGSLAISESLSSIIYGSNINGAVEDAKWRAASGGKIGCEHHKVDNSETSSAFSFSLDVLGLGRMIDLLPSTMPNSKSGATSSISTPFVASVERNGEENSLFVSGGGLGAVGQSVEDFGDNIAGIWNNTGRLTDNAALHPTKTLIGLMQPLKTSVDYVADKIDRPVLPPAPETNLLPSSVHQVDLETPTELKAQQDYDETIEASDEHVRNVEPNLSQENAQDNHKDEVEPKNYVDHVAQELDRIVFIDKFNRHIHYVKKQVSQPFDLEYFKAEMRKNENDTEKGWKEKKQRFFKYPSIEAGKNDIGYGHKITLGESFEDGITHEQMLALFIGDYAKNEKIAKSHFGPGWDDLPDNVKHLAVDVTFQSGNFDVSNWPKLHEAIRERNVNGMINECRTYYIEKGTNLKKICHKRHEYRVKIILFDYENMQK